MGEGGTAFYRIGLGLTSIAAIVWLLWPESWDQLEPEPLFAVLVALFTWIAAELNLSEKGVQSHQEPLKFSENDVNLARRVLRFRSGVAITLLRDHDYHNSIHADFTHEADQLVVEWENGVVMFHNAELRKCLILFCEALHKFNWTLAMKAGRMKVAPDRLRVAPDHIDVDWDMPDWVQKKIIEVNTAANAAWTALDNLCRCIDEVMPEARGDGIWRSA